MIIRVIRSALLVAALALVPASAFAQGTPWFVGGLGGITFNTESNAAFGAQFGVQVRPNLFVIGEVGQMRNVMPTEFSDFFDELRSDFDVPLTLDVRIPTTYAFGGVRYVQPRQTVSPFVEAGVGFGRVSLKIDRAEAFGIDFKQELEDELDAADFASNEFLLALGGGVHARFRESVGLDVGYRYTRIATDDPAINVSMIYAAIKFSR